MWSIQTWRHTHSAKCVLRQILLGDQPLILTNYLFFFSETPNVGVVNSQPYVNTEIISLDDKVVCF